MTLTTKVNRMKRKSVFLLGFLIVSLVLSLYVPNVRADSTFGKTDKGANAASEDGHVEVYIHTAPESGTITSLHLYLDNDAGVVTHARVAVYSVTDNEPDALLEESASTEIAIGFDDWKEFSGFNVPIVSGTKYGFGIQIDNADLYEYYDGSGGDGYHKSQGYGAFPNPYGTGTAWALDFSIYATYTPSIGEYTEEFSETISPSASLYLWKALFEKYEETITVSATSYGWKEKASFQTETTTVTEQINEWKELKRFFTESIIVTETASFGMELLLEILELSELIEFDATMYLTFQIIAPEVEPSTFGTLSLVIAIIALAIAVTAFAAKTKD